MLITSVSGNQYQWIRIPRTATTSYLKLFDTNDLKYPRLNVHNKFGKFHTCNKCVNNLSNFSGFTLVRNPIDRFISILYFLIELRENTPPDETEVVVCEICNSKSLVSTKVNNNFFKFYENEKIFYEFFYDNFGKNCEVKNNHDVFNTNNRWPTKPFFQTQIYWAYHPKVKVFKYEEIHKFNQWIKNELGYDTSKLEKINFSKKEKLKDIINIDFSSDKFKELAKYLFHDDFLYFGYEK